MSEHSRSAAVITAIGAIIAAAIGGNFAGNARSTVVVQLPDQEEIRLGPDEAGARIEKLSDDLIDAQKTIQALRAKLDAGVEVSRNGERKRPVPSSGGGSSRQPAEAPKQTEADDFLFELEGCSQPGGDLVCTFYVTNQGGDRTLQIIRGSRLVTADGDEYKAKEKELGSRRTRGTAGVELIHGVRTKGALHFSGVPPLSGNLPLVEIKCWAPNGQFGVQFRRVPV